MEGRSVMRIVSQNTIAGDGDQKPLPTNFAEFLPWACKQLMLDFDVVVQIKFQEEYYSGLGRNKRKSSVHRVQSQKILKEYDDENTILLTAFVDRNYQLVKIRFEKGVVKPGTLLQVISLIAPFYPNLYSLVFLPYINQCTLYELSHLLENSLISDICLDGCFVKEGNYYCVLEGTTHLRNLSLSRCSINDVVVESLMSKLIETEGVSETLLMLNLSSNFITDEGAKLIGNVLRYNRKLIYLNLAGNRITDDGAACIFDILVDFPMTEDEVLSYRSRKISFLKEKILFISKFLNEQKTQMEREKSDKWYNKTKRKISKKMSKSISGNKSNTYDVQLNKKAEAFAKATLGTFEERIAKIENGVVYALGNNILAYLNLSYNDLSFISVKKILKIVETQTLNAKSPKGLVHICLNGNNLPQCSELSEIEVILQGKPNEFVRSRRINVI